MRIFWVPVLLCITMCATRRKDHSTVRTNELNSRQFVENALVEREKVDAGILKSAKLSFRNQGICKDDEVLAVQVKSTDAVDYFEVKVVSKENSTTNTYQILGDELLIGAPESGNYDIQVRSCLDEKNAKDAENPCSAWSETQINHTFKKTSKNSQDLLRGVDELRKQMAKRCDGIRSAMAQYISSSKQNDELSVLLQKNLQSIDSRSCVDILLSKELQNLDIVALNATTETPPDFAPGQQTVQNYYAYYAQKREKSHVEGIVFLTLGSVGVALSGYEAFLKIKTTHAENVQEIYDQILEYNKKIRQIEILEYNSKIAELEVMHDILRRADHEKRTFAVNEDITKKKMKDGIDKDPNIEKADKENLISHIDQGNLDSLLSEIDRLQKARPMPSTSAMAFHFAAAFVESFVNPNYLVDNVALEWLKADIQHLKRIREFTEIGTRLQVLNTTNSKELLNRQLSDKNLQLIAEEIQSIQRKKASIEVSWQKTIAELGNAAFKGAAKGGTMGAIIGGLAGHFIPFGTFTGMKVGVGVGAFKGSYSEFIAKWNDLKSPTWSEGDMTSEQRANFDKTGAVGETTRANVQANLKQLRDAKIAEANGAKWTWDSAKAKMGAAAPWLLGTGISSVMTWVGANELRLADASPRSQFFATYSRLYKEVQRLQAFHTALMEQIYSRNCTAQ